MSNITAKIISIEPEEGIDKPIAPTLEQEVKPMTLNVAPHADQPAVKNGWVWGFTTLAALIWLGLVFTVLWLSFGSLSTVTALPAIQIMGLAALTVLPLFMIAMMAYAIRKLSAITQQSLRLSAAADAISKPDSALEARAQTLAGAVRSQVIAVNSGLETSLERMAGMENVLRGHVDALANSHIAATRQTGEITQRLAEERDGLSSVSESFDERMGALSRMMAQHSERLTQSTHIAEQKIQEARVSVEGAAAKINASSEIVRENALAATQSLTASQDQIAKLGEGIQSQSQNLDSLNTRHSEEMGALIEQLRIEQNEMNAMIEARLEKMRDMSLSAKVSAESLAQASDAGRETVEALAQSASLADSAVKARFAEMEDMVRYSNSRAESISDRAAKRVRDSLALTRLEIGRIEDDMRELEGRISDGSLSINRREIEARDVTPKPKWRRSLLKFRPVSDDDETGADILEKSEPKLMLRKPIFSAPEQEPELDQDLKPEAPLVQTQPSPQPSVETADDLTLESDLNIDMDIPNPNADILDLSPTDDAPMAVHRPGAPELRSRKPLKSGIKSGWRWRSLLGGIDQSEAEQKAQAAAASPRPAPLSDDEIINSLSQMGLSPMSVVDDGCLIEAVNTRKAKGPSDMRAIVENRLPGPIGHLRSTIENDESLRGNIDQFARRFYTSLSDIEHDREALRERLETPIGRAFILCDAALG